MLQKIIVVLVGFMMSLVGAVVPDGLFASPLGDKTPGLAQGAMDETLATVDASGQAFARINVLWVEVDGRRVTDDAWGTGDIRELRFKVGVKGIEGKGIVLGDRLLNLNPADVITVRMYRGDFAYRDIDTSSGTLQLQGSVKTTMLTPGGLGTKVRTEVDGLADRTLARSAGQSQLAYVVLTTGERVDTLAVTDGGRRLTTHDATDARAADDVPGNLAANWVKIDGLLVREYTWGDGVTERIEFDPATTGATPVVLTFNGKKHEVLSGEIVRIDHFVGEYLVFQGADGKLRIRLDGYAESYRSGAALATDLGQRLGPTASFSFSPAAPKSADTIQFTDTSDDLDGIIVFRKWDFGDGTVSVLENPRHRFAKPGTYDVTLEVTNDALQTKTRTQQIVVRNAPPVPGFEFSPRIINSDTLVTFSDRSFDNDGTIVSWLWDFGNGETSTQQNPTHRFTKPGNQTVTLLVEDDLGIKERVSKVVPVRNAPPLARFNHGPVEPFSGMPVTFTENSSDRDGHVVEWTWDFGDGNKGSGSTAVHSYERPGAYMVRLTVVDDSGDGNTASMQLVVQNRPPAAEFTYHPAVPKVNTRVHFTSLSEDPDGVLLYQQWTFHDGTVALGPTAQHTYSSPGQYDVRLEVRDAHGATDVKIGKVTIGHSAPKANFIINPIPTLRDQPVQFVDLSVDPDGQGIQTRRWDMGDGTTLFGPVVNHTYPTLGSVSVTLNVTDMGGLTDELTRVLNIINARPVITSMSVSPVSAKVGDLVQFQATAVDFDLQPGDVLVYRWNFSDGTVLTGSQLSRAFQTPGDKSVTLTVMDGDGGISVGRTEFFRIEFPNPIAAFQSNVTVATVGKPVQFTDLSQSPGGNITSWMWTFGDGASSTQQHPTHTFTQPGTRAVRLTVTDENGNQDSTRVDMLANAPPRADFVTSPASPVLPGVVVAFSDVSTDADGSIVAWRWDFDDGTTSPLRNVSKSFALPGSYFVTLEVEDNHGATHSLTRRFDVTNRAPVALWQVSAPPRLAGSPISFESQSYDPDGQPILSWHWTFGDTTSSGVEHPVQTYGQSGEYLVTLRVSDGELMSPLTTQSSRIVRVGMPHEVSITIRGQYPDGLMADLGELLNTGHKRYPASVDLTRDGRTILHIPRDNLVVNGEILQVTLPAGTAARGDVVVLKLRDAAFQLTSMVHTSAIVTDAATVIDHTFQVPLPLVTKLAVDPAIDGFLSLGTSQSEKGPVYRSPGAMVTGTGNVTYLASLGRPAEGATVVVEARYLGTENPAVPSSVRNTRDAMDDDALMPDAAGWCEITRTNADAAGHFTWRHAGLLCTDIGADGPGLGPLVPGWYEVRASATHTFATPGKSPVMRFLVDPTGTVFVATG